MFDSGSGLFYHIEFDGKDPGFDSSIVSNLNIIYSIDMLFPQVQFDIANKNNFFLAEGYGSAGAPVTIRLATSEKSPTEDTDILNDFVLERFENAGARGTLEGALRVVLTHKNTQKMRIASNAKAYKDKLSSEVIDDIISTKHKFQNVSIEKTLTKGMWLKPANQSDENFLELLKNRSLSSAGSKMFMWIDLAGKFNFKSINSMIKASTADELDLTSEVIEQHSPTMFGFINSGNQYKNEDVNYNFKEYIFDMGTGGELSDLKHNGVTSLGKRTKNIKDSITKIVPTRQTYFNGFSHSLLPSRYNEAIYNNNAFNFPYMLRFDIRQRPKNALLPGNKILIKFPNSNKDAFEEGFSNEYIITSVNKRVQAQQYWSTVNVVSNSVVTTEVGRFYKNG